MTKDRLLAATLNFGMQPATQVNSAFYPPWDGKMSTSQRAVMLCGWGVKAGMACLQVKVGVAISERFRKNIKGTFQMSRFTLFTFTN